MHQAPHPRAQANPPSRRSPAEKSPPAARAARIEAWSGSSTSRTHPGGAPGCRRPISRSPRGCGPGRSASSWARSTCSAAGAALRTAIEEGKPHSMILYGPPGTGKTTLARLLAVNAQAAFEEASAVNAGRAEVREVLERARAPALHQRRAARSSSSTRSTASTRRSRTRCCRRWRRGSWRSVGATTENPYFEVNSALLSRCRVYELHALETEHVLALLRRSLGDERGITASAAGGRRRARVPGRALGRDARTALSALELACETVGEGGRGDPARGRGRAPAQRDPLRQGGRRPLRPDLGLDQGHARLRSRRLAALPGRRCSRAARTRASSPGGW